jgi:flavin-binding protein dodecin
MNPLSYRHYFIEIDNVLVSRFIIGIKGWEATFLTYAHRMVSQQRGTILFVFSIFTLYPVRRLVLPGHEIHIKSNIQRKEDYMSGSVYKVVELVGTSDVSWEQAAANAIATAGKTLRDLRVAEVTKLDMTVKEGKIASYRARVTLSFKYEAS